MTKLWCQQFSKSGGNYGCSFVAKLGWKKKFFFEKIFLFYKNIHYLQKKIILYGKKKLYIFFTEKTFFTENKKNICLIWEIFLSRKYIFILQKTFFDHKKYIC